MYISGFYCCFSIAVAAFSVDLSSISVNMLNGLLIYMLLSHLLCSMAVFSNILLGELILRFLGASLLLLPSARESVSIKFVGLLFTCDVIIEKLSLDLMTFICRLLLFSLHHLNFKLAIWQDRLSQTLTHTEKIRTVYTIQ